MKIFPVQNFSYNINNTSKTETSKKNKTFYKTAAMAGVSSGILIGGLLIHKNIKIRNIKEVLCSKFPNDVKYRKELLNSIGISQDNWFSIRSIIGGQEYKSIISDFSNSPVSYTSGKSLLTKKQDDYELIGVNNRTFRLSMHNHTINSDGKMSVSELLDQAARYADLVAKSNKNKSAVLAKEAPFTIAISDHDTIEGCKEAIKIIAANPKKYKNLRVVLGAELSVENRMLGDDLIKPIQNHLVINCINPFDKELNNYLNKFKIVRKKAASDFLEKYKDELKKTPAKDIVSNLSIEESIKYSSAVKYGVNYPWYYLKGYIKSKLSQNNEKIALDTFNSLQSKFEPKLDLQDYCMDMAEAMNIISKQEYGYMTLAHIALTPVGNCVKTGIDAHKSLDKLISIFKSTGGAKSLCAEVYYPYYGDVAASKEWLNTIKTAVNNNKLLPTGGLDSHGKSIFYSNL